MAFCSERSENQAAMFIAGGYGGGACHHYGGPVCLVPGGYAAPELLTRKSSAVQVLAIDGQSLTKRTRRMTEQIANGFVGGGSPEKS